MDYKLLRALSIFLQAGLVILLLLLMSLILFSCTSTSAKKATVNLNTEAQKAIMEQRLLNEVRQQRQPFKVLCSTPPIRSAKTLYHKEVSSYESKPTKHS